MFLQSDVILESVTYGGVVNSACHGVGQTQVGWNTRYDVGGLLFVQYEKACVSRYLHRDRCHTWLGVGG